MRNQKFILELNVGSIEEMLDMPVMGEVQNEPDKY